MRPALPLVLLLAVPAAASAASSRTGSRAWCGTTREAARDAVAAHREAARASSASVRTPATDVGQIAVVQDEGDLALLHNPMDLQEATLRFTPADGGFSVTRLQAPLFPEAGTRLFLNDDDSASVALPFAFPFYGTTYSSVWVNSDGNLTFGALDADSTARTLGRLLGGPPRIAPLLADLNPERSGTVSWSAAGDRFTVTWSAVPQFDHTDRNTLQATLYADGRVELAYAKEVSAVIDEGVAGIAPGGGADFTAVDFANATGVSGRALAESFRDADALDLVAVSGRFFASHPDDFDQLVIFTNRRLTDRGTFAFEQTIRNQVTGIGANSFDVGHAYGSGSRLSSVAMMDALSKYPDDLLVPFLGADSALAVVAHEVGHRYLAQARFRDGTANSSDLLGRDLVHWSFFADTDGSHLEGNDIVEEGGRFRTVAAGVRYSPLDQYLMGLRAASEVPPFFVVRTPTGAGTDPGRDPEVGVTFAGTRKDVTIDDVVAAIGRRAPAFGEAPRTIRQAFVLVSIGGPPTAAELEKVERIRAAWEPFYATSTEGRGAAEARLQ